MSATNGNAPVTYKQWRDIYHRELSAMGYSAQNYFGLKLLKAPDVMLQAAIRLVWLRTLRLKRIKRQLHEANERQDASWCEAMLEMLETDDE